MGRPPHSHHRASRPDTTASTKMNAAAAATTFAWSTFAAPLRLRVTRGALRTAPARALPRSARAEAKRTNKPLFVTFRCVPCLACKGFDAEVAKNNQHIIRLAQEKFIAVRQVEMKGVNLS